MQFLIDIELLSSLLICLNKFHGNFHLPGFLQSFQCHLIFFLSLSSFFIFVCSLSSNSFAVLYGIVVINSIKSVIC